MDITLLFCLHHEVTRQLCFYLSGAVSLIQQKKRKGAVGSLGSPVFSTHLAVGIYPLLRGLDAVTAQSTGWISPTSVTKAFWPSLCPHLLVCARQGRCRLEGLVQKERSRRERNGENNHISAAVLKLLSRRLLVCQLCFSFPTA